MTLDKKQDTLLGMLFEVLDSSDDNPMKDLLEVVLNAVMKMERNMTLKARPYERSEEREGYANGFKDKRLADEMIANLGDFLKDGRVKLNQSILSDLKDAVSSKVKTNCPCWVLIK